MKVGDDLVDDRVALEWLAPIRRREVTPLRKTPRRGAQTVGRTIAAFNPGPVEAKTWPSTKGPADTLRGGDERLLQPQIKGLREEPRSLWF